MPGWPSGPGWSAGSQSLSQQSPPPAEPRLPIPSSLGELGRGEVWEEAIQFISIFLFRQEAQDNCLEIEKIGLISPSMPKSFLRLYSVLDHDIFSAQKGQFKLPIQLILWTYYENTNRVEVLERHQQMIVIEAIYMLISQIFLKFWKVDSSKSRDTCFSEKKRMWTKVTRYYVITVYNLPLPRTKSTRRWGYRIWTQWLRGRNSLHCPLKSNLSVPVS